jgi:hypothetical protein
MTTYTVRRHPELDEITAYDKNKLTKVIEEYNEWYDRHKHENDRNQPGQTDWAYAIYDIKDYINKNMVDELSTLEETQAVEGNGHSCFPVSFIFSQIDTIREELLSQEVHPTLLQHEPELLMDILNKLEICTRHVIQNTSIQRLHAKSWVHTDALRGHGRTHELGVREDALLAPVERTSQSDISTLLCQMNQLCVST